MKINATAKADRRSMNKEIIARLERSFVSLSVGGADDSTRFLLLQRINELETKVEAYERICRCQAE